MTVLACVPPVTIGSPGDVGTLPPVDPTASPQMQLVHATNAMRRAERVPDLRVSEQLMRAAQLHAEQMAQTGRLAHTIEGVAYPRPHDRLAAVGYRWRGFAENVAMGNHDAAGTLHGLITSPSHRENILSAAHNEIGTGYALDARGRPYWVQVFARPR